MKSFKLDNPNLKLTPQQSRLSGDRMHAYHRLYEHKKEILRIEKDQEELILLKPKPLICKKSKMIVRNLIE